MLDCCNVVTLYAVFHRMTVSLDLYWEAPYGVTEVV